jgi:hypothetical protein
MTAHTETIYFRRSYQYQFPRSEGVANNSSEITPARRVVTLFTSLLFPLIG